MKHLLIFAMLFTQAVFPNEEESVNEVPVTNPITVTQTEYSIEAYSSSNISYTVQEGVETVVTFSSSNTDVATVNDLGVVSALAAGETTVTIHAKVGEETFDTPIKVSVYSVTGTIDFKYNRVYVHRGTNYHLEYTLSNPLLQNKDIVWISNDPDVVEVVDGVVTGVSKGSATITATIGDQSSSIDVDVIVPLQEIAFNPEALKITLEETAEIPEIIYVPYDTSGREEPTYHIENNNIVDLVDGQLLAKSIGKTKVIARIDDIEAVLEVEVLPKVNDDGAVIMTLLPIEETDKFVKFGINEGSLRSNRRVDLSLDIDSLKAALKANKEIIVSIPESYYEENMRYVETIDVPMEAFEGIETLTFITLQNDAGQTKIKYEIDGALKETINLKYRVQKIADSSSFSKMIDGRAFEIRFYNEKNVDNLKVHLNAKDIDSAPQQLHFIYKIETGNKLSDVDQSSKVDDNGHFIMDVNDDHYLLTFNAISKSSDQGVIWFLFGVVSVIAIAGGVIYYKGKGKSKKDVV